jgi:hypothetical protein
MRDSGRLTRVSPGSRARLTHCGSWKFLRVLTPLEVAEAVRLRNLRLKSLRGLICSTESRFGKNSAKRHFIKTSATQHGNIGTPEVG